MSFPVQIMIPKVNISRNIFGNKNNKSRQLISIVNDEKCNYRSDDNDDDNDDECSSNKRRNNNSLSLGNFLQIVYTSNTTTKKRPLSASSNNKLSFPFGSSSDETVATELSGDTASTILSNACALIRKKSVHFSKASPKVCFTLARSEYTFQEKVCCWYQKDEYIEFSRECVKQVKRMENGETFRDKKYSSRGLESNTRLAALSKIQNRKQAIYAALDEQDEQRQLGSSHDDMMESIGQAYRNASSSCQMWATRMGMLDQRAVEEWMDE